MYDFVDGRFVVGNVDAAYHWLVRVVEEDGWRQTTGSPGERHSFELRPCHLFHHTLCQCHENREEVFQSLWISAMPETRSNEALVWIDCEMTGLDLEKDTIMSLACFITDAQLILLDEGGYEAVILHSKEQLDAMGEWCKVHHGASGLTQACLGSTTTAETAAHELLDYIKDFVPDRRRALLAGNTVHSDKAFLAREPWSQVIKHLHHRILDVSAIKEAARRWAPVEVLKKSPQKAGKHEAKADILESIAEAKYYKEVFFDQNYRPTNEND